MDHDYVRIANEMRAAAERFELVSDPIEQLQRAGETTAAIVGRGAEAERVTYVVDEPGMIEISLRFPF